MRRCQISGHAARALRPAVLLLLIALRAGGAGGAGGAEPLLTVAKNTLLGGMTGLILGGTLTLVVDEEERSETVRWGVVIGAFAGFGAGVYQVVSGRDDLFGALPARTAAEERPVAGEPARCLPEGAGRGGPALRLVLAELRW